MNANATNHPGPASQTVTWIAFAGVDRVGAGDPHTVAAAVKRWAEAHDEGVLVFDAQTSHPVELDLRGSLADVLGRLPAPPEEDAPAAEIQPVVSARAPGRPKLGVVAREVTLLPRHWDWLAAQPGGASVALRKLVEQTMRDRAESDRRRLAQESAYRFMNALAGDLPGFEEATRALFAGDPARLAEVLREWPADVRDHALHLAAGA